MAAGGCLITAAAFLFVLMLEIKYSPSTGRLRLSQAHHHHLQAGNTSHGNVESEGSTVQVEPTLVPSSPPPPAEAITCDRSRYFYDICSIHVPTVLDPTTSTFFINHPSATHPTVQKIRPYPRKLENFTMSRIKEVSIITSRQPIPHCHVTHSSPALVFSAGGYTGNFFHEMSDGFIPLFITVNSIFHQDQDVVLVISKARDWWVRKYVTLLQKISKHQIIALENDTSTHCFPSATLGLISHGFLAINQNRMPNSKSLNHFHEFLGKAYGTNNHPSYLNISNPRRPRVVLMNRPRGSGRELLNVEEVKVELEKVGFDVIVFEPTPTTPLRQSFELINSSHAMVGVHGAALTHLLFLRSRAVLVQVVPLGTEWVAEACFGNAARAKGLEYVEYKVRTEESSLIEKYSKEDMMIKDPVGFLKGKSWSSSVMNIYLKEQSVRLDLIRFRKYLKEAYNKAKEFMDKEHSRQN